MATRRRTSAIAQFRRRNPEFFTTGTGPTRVTHPIRNDSDYDPSKAKGDKPKAPSVPVRKARPLKVGTPEERKEKAQILREVRQFFHGGTDPGYGKGSMQLMGRHRARYEELSQARRAKVGEADERYQNNRIMRDVAGPDVGPDATDNQRSYLNVLIARIAAGDFHRHGRERPSAVADSYNRAMNSGRLTKAKAALLIHRAALMAYRN